MLVQVNMGILRWHLFCYFDSSKLPPTKIAHGFGVRFLLCLYVKKHVVVGNHSVMLRRTRDGAQIFFVAEKRFVPISQPIVCFEWSYTPYIWYFFSLLHVWVHFVWYQWWLNEMLQVRKPNVPVFNTAFCSVERRGIKRQCLPCLAGDMFQDLFLILWREQNYQVFWRM